MASSFFTLGVAGILAVLVLQKISTLISNARFNKQNGCMPVYQLPQPERIFGYDLFRIQLTALKKKKLLEVNLERFSKNGITWSCVMMGTTFFNTIDPRNIQTILSTSFEDFGVAERLAIFGPLLGQGIFTTDGKNWDHSRNLVKRTFSRSQIGDLSNFETHIQHLIAKIPQDGSTVDLQTLFFKLTLDSATEFLFGESLHSLISPESSEQQKFGAAFDLAQSKLAIRYRQGRLNSFVDIFMPDNEFEQACRTVHDFVDNIVDKTLEKSHAKCAENFVEGDDGLENYFFLKELAKATRDPKRLRDELLNILLAGRDTTASLLSITFHILARRADVFKKLKAEVDELRGTKPDYDTLKSMMYLRYTLNETLRLYPIVPGNARVALRNTILPHGGGTDRKGPIFIAKGQVVAYSVYCMHRRKDIYGDDALEFKPDRWATKLNPYENLRPGWAYLPFNGGPRMCVGQQFALMEASYTIVRLLQEFGGIEDRDGTPFVEQLSLTLASARGVQVAMIPRQSG